MSNERDAADNSLSTLKTLIVSEISPIKKLCKCLYTFRLLNIKELLMIHDYGCGFCNF